MTKEEKQKIIDEYYDDRAWLDSLDGGMTSLEWNGRDAALEQYYKKVIKPLENEMKGLR